VILGGAIADPEPAGESMSTERAAPDRRADEAIASPIQSYLESLHRKHSTVLEGGVATYIPELAKADPSWFGIAIASTDGKVYEVGDTRREFTIQSISKPLTYGLALEDVGREAVLARIGIEPTGEAFNSISLAPNTGCPLNPMINAGAIVAASLVAGRSPQDRFHRLLSVYSLYAGRELSLDRAVYESEKETGHRNRAIGHMLRNFDVLDGDPEAPLDLYFRQCSIAVDCRDLSVMAATLANGGVNPLSGERAVRPEFVENVLSVMTTCGMYDHAGEWLYWVGLPAKSGVAGGIMAVLPGQLGIGVFSPPLDAQGNSVRGVRVCKDLSRDFNLHFLRVPRFTRSALRAQYSLAQVPSKRVRSERERSLLDQRGDAAQVYDLQGDLTFSVLELVVRTVVDSLPALRYAILDLGRVTSLDESAAAILCRLVADFADRGRRILFVGAAHHHRFLRKLEEGLLSIDRLVTPLAFPERDAALEWCENRLLAESEPASSSSRPIALAAHGLCRALSPEEVAELAGLLVRQSFTPGELIIRRGEAADKLYLLVAGEVSVVVTLPDGGLVRLSTLSPGMAFGELAVVDRTLRSADVRADGPVECYALSMDAFDDLATTHPSIKMRLLENLLRNVSQMLTRLNKQLVVLAR
jgi:glutaminase